MKLPKGYYAVQTDFENASKETFTYKGVTYEVTAGEDLFATIHEANAKATEIPTEILAGLDYEAFDTPVILFSVGVHDPDKFTFDRDITLLGEQACVDPNLPAPNREDAPLPNPARRAEEESVLKGSYWHGKITVVNGNDPKSILWDGLTLQRLSFRDLRTKGEGVSRFSARNIVHVSPFAYMIYYFETLPADSLLHREVEFRNIRAQNLDDYDYGTNFGLINAEKLAFRNACYDLTGQTFGPTNIYRSIPTAAQNAPQSEILFENCYFGHLSGFNGICFSAGRNEAKRLRVTVDKCTFADACRRGESPLNTHLLNRESTLTVRDSLFVDTRGGDAAVAHSGCSDGITLENCEMRGFQRLLGEVPPLPVEAPDRIENRGESWQSGTEDSHTVIAEQDADFAALDALYEGTKAYYGDQHVHTACGGTSDGSFPMKDWVAAMDEKGVDFAIVVDHRQMRGFFLPEWDEERFVIGTEPGAHITGLNAVRMGMDTIHYNMLFPHKYGLAMVLCNFPEFEFCGDELTGSFKYPNFTRERFAELTRYVQSIGGMMVHPHPKTMMASDDPLDYDLGEHTYLETIYGSTGTAATAKNYELWVALLAAGKRIYASSGSDTHGRVSNLALSTFYTKRRHSEDFFRQMHKGDYTVGRVGLKMCIDGYPMGAEIPYREGMRLTLRMDDFFSLAWKPNTVYELRIVTDRGVAYASRCNGKLPQAVSLKVEKRAFYRAEIYDVSNCQWVAHGNPIWMDRC